MVNFRKILNFIFCMSIFSIFLPNAIYVAFFALYIVLGWIFIMMNSHIKTFNVLKGTKLTLVGLLIFLIYGITIIMFGEKNIDGLNLYLKLPLNLVFIITFFICSSVYKMNFEKIFKTVYFCLFLSTIQVIVALIQTNSLQLFLSGISSSNEAFQITQTFIWFGNESKNIWATKILLVSLPVVLYRLNTRKKFIDKLMFGLLVFCTLMTFSRTALVSFVVAVTIFFLFKVFRSKKIYKYFVILISPYVLYKGYMYIYDNFLHITMTNTDGLYSRFVMYETILENLGQFSIFGEGIYAASRVLPLYSTEYFGELYIHNIFLNSYLDLGIVGLISYCLFLIGFYICLNKNLPKQLSWSLYASFFTIIISQYVGYDNDLIIFVALTYVIATQYRKELSNENTNSDLPLKKSA